MPFIALLIASLICTYLALRIHVWWLCLLAVFLALPIALVANVNYEGLMLLPFVLLAMTIALRWTVSPIGWAGLLLIATGIWFVGAASPFLLRWPRAVFWVLPVGLLTGLAALIWSHVPRSIASHRSHTTQLTRSIRRPCPLPGVLS